jgi:superfamily II DNA or RNA helicase
MSPARLRAVIATPSPAVRSQILRCRDRGAVLYPVFAGAVPRHPPCLCRSMPWESGDRLVVRRQDWLVLKTTAFVDCTALDLASQDPPGVHRTLLIPFDRPHRAPLSRPAMVSARRWCEEVAAIAAGSFPFGGLRFCGPAIRLLPYQLEPALAIFRHGATRLLIADDVGVGKTVEAGLIIREVTGTAHAARILILVPASLKDQWRLELRTLFDIDGIDADAAWLRKSGSELPADVNPWSLPGTYLASTDFVKRAEALRPLEDVRWDLLVIDEAHAITPGSHRRAAAHALACRSRLVVLLTATPHAGDDHQFEQLCAIGSVSPAESIVCFRRSRADVLPHDRPPKSRVIRVRLSDAERRLHRELDSYTGRLWATACGRAEASPALLATILRKRALSSPGSLVATLRRRLELMEVPASEEIQLWLPLDDEDRGSVEDLPPDAVVGGTGLGNAGEERTRIERILETAASADSESKIRVLVRLLGRVREPAIVFSEYRDTADRLRQILSDHGHRVVVLHGGLHAAERRAAIASFNRGDALLVATDAAAEGLNLQQVCRLVIHFELPWTPARLHQRCGRVNRIGQHRPVHEIALVADDTAERFVIGPLVRRAALAGPFRSDSLAIQLSGPGNSENRAGGAPVSLPSPDTNLPACLATMNLRAEAAAEANRLELLRRVGRLGRAHQGAPIVPVARTSGATRRPDPALTIVVTTTIRDRSGSAVEERTMAVAGLLCGVGWPRRRAAVRRLVALLLEHIRPALLLHQSRQTRRRLFAVRTMCARVRDARERREAAIERAVRSTARELVQAGLFDRRAFRTRPGSISDPMLRERAPAPSETREAILLRARMRVRAVLIGRVR